MPELHFRVLGPLTATSANGSGKIAGIKPRILLVALLLRANTLVSVERISETLWDGEPPRTAIENVRTNIYLLRSAIGSSARLRSWPKGYELQVDPMVCDHLRFAQIVRQARADLRRGNPAAAADCLAGALSLWRAETAAPGIPRYGPMAVWLDHLDEERVRATEDLADAMIRSGEPRAALRELNGVLANDCLRTRVWQLQMRAYRALGELGKVEDVYHEAVRVFRTELGANAESELSACYRESMRG
jgi:DNA-binding SARP family transcriptional activator